MEYYVVSASDTISLGERVTALLNGGWQLYGNLVIGGSMCYQVVTRLQIPAVKYDSEMFKSLIVQVADV